ncbi:radical SAM protein [Anoxynatronum sibiricum]|uniref:Radical SAM protein n=1 Tax=Anoxynatronum sibiricum TaxID=210623 RepID=A0ABU9VTQ4_9CLOT
MDLIQKAIKKKPMVLLVYTQRMVRGRTFEMIENLGIITLAAQLNANGFEAKAYTGITTDAVNTIERLKDQLFAVCFYCDFDNQTAVTAIIKGLKKEKRIREDTYLVVGGPHTLHMTDKDLDRYGADAIIKGDGEESLFAWLQGKTQNTNINVPGEICPGKNAEYIQLKDFSKYQLPQDDAVLNYVERPLLSVITARGCPYRCAFCFEGGRSKNLRMRSAEAVLEEIQVRLEKSRRPRYLFFCDDTFTTSLKRLQALLQGLKKLRESHDFVWFCEGHPGFLSKHPELIPDMMDSGMVRMQIGLESGVDRVLDAYGKQACTEDIREVVAACYQAGLPQLTGNFIIGGAFETPKTLETTTRYALDLLQLAPGMMDLSTTFLMPLPGTEISRAPQNFNIELEDQEYLTSLEDFPVNRTCSLSLPEICRGRAVFLTRISNRMKEQFSKGEIPSWRIRRDFQLAFRYGIAAGYLKYIYCKDPAMVAYHRQLNQFQGLLKEWWDMDASEKENWIIQSAVEDDMVDYKTLGAGEVEILLRSGTSSAKEMASMMNRSAEEVKACLEEMSRKHLVLFSPSL